MYALIVAQHREQQRQRPVEEARVDATQPPHALAPTGSRAATRQPPPSARRRLELAAVDGDALAQAEQPAVLGQAVVDHLDAHLAGDVGHADARAHGLPALARAPQRLLHEPVGRQVDARGERHGLAVDPQLDVQAGRARALDQRAHVRKARLRREPQLLVLAAQHAEQPAQLGQRLAAGVLDDRERRLGALRVALRHPPRGARLHGHRAERVRDHVVEVAGDPRALLERGGVGGRVALALGALGALVERAVEARTRAQHLPEQDRGDDDQADRAQVGGEPVG